MLLGVFYCHTQISVSLQDQSIRGAYSMVWRVCRPCVTPFGSC